jgi:hypothetical protein
MPAPGSRLQFRGQRAACKTMLDIWKAVTTESYPLASGENRARVVRHMSDLRSQINSLSAAEKAELLDTLWESLEADSASLTDAQRAEL